MQQKTKRIRKPGLMCDFCGQSILVRLHTEPKEVARSSSTGTLQSRRVKAGNWICGIISIPFMLAIEMNSWLSLFHSALYVGRLNVEWFPEFIAWTKVLGKMLINKFIFTALLASCTGEWSKIRCIPKGPAVKKVAGREHHHGYRKQKVLRKIRWW